MKTISSAVVAKALEELRASKIDLMNALAEAGGPSNWKVASTTQQENVVTDPPAANKPSLMERRATAQTYEVKKIHVLLFHQIIYDVVLGLHLFK